MESNEIIVLMVMFYVVLAIAMISVAQMMKSEIKDKFLNKKKEVKK